jgi:site-specific recombinase XerD
VERFNDFIKERRYLLNVSKRTLDWYGDCFSAWRRYAGAEPAQWVINMREAGIKVVSINTYICGMNAYWKWAGEKTKLRYLKEEQRILATLTLADVQALVSAKNIAAKAISRTNLRRARLVALTILDTGLRASEVLGLTTEQINLDALTIKVLGKGGKERIVPFSLELRKALWRYKAGDGKRNILFGTKNETSVTLRNLERDFKELGQKCGITGVRFSPHTLRHTFAVSYLRNGGNLEFLRRILGHSSLTTTQKYLKSLGIEDLGAVHNGLSPLSARR